VRIFLQISNQHPIKTNFKIYKGKLIKKFTSAKLKGNLIRQNLQSKIADILLRKRENEKKDEGLLLRK
jgi:hypothetical protein